jgi:hypothetical protein
LPGGVVVDADASGSGPIGWDRHPGCERDIDDVDWDAWAPVERIVDSAKRVIVGEH